jgi:hypothetical protein
MLPPPLPISVELLLHAIEHALEEPREKLIDRDDKQPNDDNGNNNTADCVGSEFAPRVCKDTCRLDADVLDFFTDGIE